jgi:hypothetical protein
MRVRPREDLNSLASIMWHIARIEDIMLDTVLSGRDQVCDAALKRRLEIMRPDFGIGMTSAEVAELSRRIDVGALRDYRDAVGRRTREIVTAFDEKDWEGRSRLRRLSALRRKAPSARAGSGMSRRSPAVPARRY